ncbi:Cnl2/NKP2 family protein-domain-containing protein [Amylocarpus encephaloides]|uniref:Cnl2/NKP2 family protein-domain-containing protein n=1 Tax=Amylocarpus encephaloides TaxID=45428 RepID=A0A9P8C3K7_9HELO|nr:Cnl2/NKP2 family protein-domain-containing protein [Amylocarpus encephaloides]
MAPTEATILSTFLLPPAHLPAIISLQAFTDLFPRSQQSSPQVKALYRDLQHQRARIVDAVTHNIASEVQRGNTQQRAVVRERRKAETEEQDDEVDIEYALFGPSSNLDAPKSHSLTSILPELELAASQVEEEIRRLEDEAETLLGEIHATVGGLSDIRYGRLANSNLPEQVVDGLERLEASCRAT